MYTIGSGEMHAEELLAALERMPAIALIRGCPAAYAADIAGAAADAGFTAIEFTTDRPDAIESLTAAREVLDGRAQLGAGTVIKASLLAEAVDAGVRFTVTPDLRLPLIARAKELGVLMIPGCLTPTEVGIAQETGASIVKLFPAGPLGPGYLSAILGPFPDARLLVTGGVTLDLVPGFLQAGALAVGIGADVFARQLLEKGAVGDIAERARRAIAVVSGSRA